MDVPNIVRREHQLLIVADDGFISLFSYKDGETKDDVQLPKGEVGYRIEKLWASEKRELMVVVLAAMGQEIVVEAKEMSRD